VCVCVCVWVCVLGAHTRKVNFWKLNWPSSESVCCTAFSNHRDTVPSATTVTQFISFSTQDSQIEWCMTTMYNVFGLIFYCFDSGLENITTALGFSPVTQSVNIFLPTICPLGMYCIGYTWTLRHTNKTFVFVFVFQCSEGCQSWRRALESNCQILCVSITN
jgi:hypothetical protein